MPEGPSIVILKEQAMPFKNRKVLQVTGNAKIDLARLQNQKVVDIKSWGKHFLICFKHVTVRVHLLLFGSYRINEARDIKPRIQLTFTNGTLAFYNCSVKFIEEPLDEVYDWEVDTMSTAWNPAKATAALKKAKNLLACDALLNQDIFAGSGNIVKNEVLFITRIHPESLVKALPPKKLKELVNEVPAYCHQFYEWKKKFVLAKHWQAHKKKICPRCNIPFSLHYLGKTNRRSFYCENCQVKYT